MTFKAFSSHKFLTRKSKKTNIMMSSIFSVNPITQSNTNENTVTFNVGGRIFEIRRTLLDHFPHTILARSASDLWNNTNNNNTDPTKKIFIDRDSIRFSFILDYMRENGVVELPVTIPKDMFLKELEYYGFDTGECKTKCITCTIPTFEAITHVNKLHQKFLERRIKMNLMNDLSVLAYACYCEVVASTSLKINFIILHTIGTDYMLPLYLLQIDAKLDTQKICKLSLANTVRALGELYRNQSAWDPNHPTVKQFNKCLSYYGFECETYECFSFVGVSAQIKLKSVLKTI